MKRSTHRLLALLTALLMILQIMPLTALAEAEPEDIPPEDTYGEYLSEDDASESEFFSSDESEDSGNRPNMIRKPILKSNLSRNKSLMGTQQRNPLMTHLVSVFPRKMSRLKKTTIPSTGILWKSTRSQKAGTRMGLKSFWKILHTLNSGRRI